MPFAFAFENKFCGFVKKVLTLRPIKKEQMPRQHCNILIIKGIHSLKSFECNAYVLMPSATCTSYCGSVRPFCFSNPTDIN